MVTRGRILFAVERYKKGEASLGRAAELAGVRVGQMMTQNLEWRAGSSRRTTFAGWSLHERLGSLCVA
jgi:hypothetical protein